MLGLNVRRFNKARRLFLQPGCRDEGRVERLDKAGLQPTVQWFWIALSYLGFIVDERDHQSLSSFLEWVGGLLGRHQRPAAGLLPVFPETREEFLSDDTDVAGGLDANLDAVAGTDRHYRNDDVAVDDDPLRRFSGKNKHGETLPVF